MLAPQSVAKSEGGGTADAGTVTSQALTTRTRLWLATVMLRWRRRAFGRALRLSFTR